MKTKELNSLKEIIKNYYHFGYDRVDVIKEKSRFRILCIEKNENYTKGFRIAKNFTIGSEEIRNIKIESLWGE